MLNDVDDPQTVITSDEVEHGEHIPDNHENVENGTTVLQPGQTLRHTGWKVKPPSEVTFERKKESHRRLHLFDLETLSRGGFHDELSNYSLLTDSVRMEYRDVNRWKMAWRVKAASGASHRFAETQYREPKWFRPRINDLPDLLDIVQDDAIGHGFCAAAFVYGGLHALAWSAHFESLAQSILWRVSSCVVMGGLPAIRILIYIVGSYTDRTLLHDLVSFILVVLTCITSLAYVLARAYLVVECFIQLFNFPAGVFDVPQWTAYFPHIS